MRLMSVDEAVRQVADGATVIIGGSGAGHALPQLFIDTLAAVDHDRRPAGTSLTGGSIGCCHVRRPGHAPAAHPPTRPTGEPMTDTAPRTADRTEAEILAEDLQACTVPVVGVLGNHDYECGQPQEVERSLTEAGVKLLNGEAYEIGGVGFAGGKGFIGGFGRYMLSSFGEPEIKHFVQAAVDDANQIENSLRMLRTERKVVVLHYAPVAETLEGEPAGATTMQAARDALGDLALLLLDQAGFSFRATIWCWPREGVRALPANCCVLFTAEVRASLLFWGVATAPRRS